MSYSSAVQQQFVYWVDIRGNFNAFEEPPFELFGAAARKLFRDDPNLVIKELKGNLNGLYKLEANGEPSGSAIVLSRTDAVSGVKEDVTIPLATSCPPRHAKRDDLFVTIVDGNMGEAKKLVGRDFDAAFAEFGRVVKPTTLQRYRDSSILNGNRYVVMDINSKVPDRLDLGGHSFLLKYRGKKWYCSSCGVDHVGPCDYLKRFYELKEKKEKTLISMGITGDSSIRLFEHVGLLADVTSMSGASAGQLVTVVENHPNLGKHSEVVLAAGANDVRTDDLLSAEDVAKRIDLSMKRVESLVERDLNRNFLFVNTTPKSENLSKLDFIARKYFAERVRNLSVKSDNFDLLDPNLKDSHWEDGHPNEKGSKRYVQAIANCYPRVVQDLAYTTTSKPYRGVLAKFLSGCSGCRTRGQFVSAGFCSACVGKISSGVVAEPDLLSDIVKEYQNFFPVDKKRPREPNTSSDDNYVPKKIVS